MPSFPVPLVIILSFPELGLLLFAFSFREPFIPIDLILLFEHVTL